MAKKILLVEDDRLIALTEAKALEDFGYEVLSAYSGEEAVAMALDEGRRVDLVLMDIDLGPGLDGPEAARRILAGRNLPIVFLSAHSERERVALVRGITRYGYVVKDSGYFVLQSSIEMAFELFAAHERTRVGEARLTTLLDTLVRPDGAIEELGLADILDLPTLQSLMESLSSLSGAVTAILDLEGRVLVATGWQDICVKFHRACPESAASCTESDLFLSERVEQGKYVEYRCENGMWDIVTPLFIESRHVGNIYSGQFFYDDDEVDEAFFAAQADRYGYDRESYLSALKRVPRFSRERVARFMDHLVELTQFVSRLSFSNLTLLRAIAERRRAEERLEESLAAKETLMRELQHRVKNSLNIVSSFLGLNMGELEDERYRKVFQEAIDRVRCVAMIYEKLSEPTSAGRIDLARYLGDLIELLGTTYAAKAGNLRVSSELAAKETDHKKAVSLGLILNELFTNAIKHAYPDGAEGEIRISLKGEPGGWELRVSDDGPGLPPGVELASVKSLGLRVSSLLAEGIDGSLAFENGGGANAVVRFQDP